MFVRYELYVDDEPQDIGIFHGLSELGMEEGVIDDCMHPFDEMLKIPVDVFEKYQTKSYFTELGEKRFSDDIKKITVLYDSGGLFDVRRICAETLDDIVYQDPYQAVVKIG